MTQMIAKPNFVSKGSWVEKPACTARDTNALQIVALAEKLISTSFCDSVLSIVSAAALNV